MKNRLLSMLLSVAILFTLSLFFASAESMPESSNVNQFLDVHSEDWYYDSVMYMQANGLFSGTDYKSFSPHKKITRVMIVTVLARFDKVDISKYSGSNFSDVSPNEWYAPYMKWGYDTGIINGYSDGTFRPQEDVTREQMATIIANYIAENCNFKATTKTTETFNDINFVSHWAVNAVKMMRSNRLILGDNNGNFNPKATATRAEAATIFARLCKYTEGDIVGNSKQLFNIDFKDVEKISLWYSGEILTITNKEQMEQIIKDTNEFRYDYKKITNKPDPSKGEVAPPGLYGAILVEFLDNSGDVVCSLIPVNASAGYVTVLTETDIINYYSQGQMNISFEYFEKLFLDSRDR